MLATTCKVLHVFPLSSLLLRTILIFPKSLLPFNLPSQKASKSPFGAFTIAGIRKDLYPSFPETKTFDCATRFKENKTEVTKIKMEKNLLIEPKYKGYSDIGKISKKKIGVLYEADGYEDIRFQIKNW